MGGSRGEVREASGGLEALGGWAGLRGPGGLGRNWRIPQEFEGTE